MVIVTCASCMVIVTCASYSVHYQLIKNISHFPQLFRLAYLLGLDGVNTPVAMPIAGVPMPSGQGHTSILIANAAIEVRCGYCNQW